MRQKKHPLSYNQRFDTLEILEVTEKGMLEPGLVPAQQDLQVHCCSGEIYGRKKEQEELENAYRRCCLQGSADQEIILITGPSGVGKSELARSLDLVVTQSDGYFVTGKCDQFQQSEPLAPFQSAFSQLVAKIIAKGKDAVTCAREKVDSATYGDSDLLMSMMPAFGELFDDLQITPRSFDLLAKNRSPQRASNPSIEALCNFLNLFCSARHPLVCFLDDIQWIDRASLELMRALALLPKIEGFVLLCTCRGDEVSTRDPLSEALREIESHQVIITEFRLGNMSPDALNEMVAGMLGIQPEDCMSLADTLFRRTSGNAFFAKELLNAFREKKYLYLDDNQKWVWDKIGVEDGLLLLDCDHFLAGEIERIAQGSGCAEEVLKISACLGSRFYDEFIFAAVSAPRDEAKWALSILEERGLINKTGKTCSWMHDRFQEAAYSLIPEGDRKAFHVTIGRRLLRVLSQDTIEEGIFVILNQFWYGIDLVDDQQTRDKLAELCLYGGGKAVMSSAFDDAASYFFAGIDLLADDHWTSQYELSLALLNSAAEMSCCTGKLDAADELLYQILTNARTLQDKLRAYETQLYSLGTRQRFAEAIDVGFGVLHALGEPLPNHARFLKIVAETLKTKRKLKNLSEVDIINLSPLKDWQKLAAIRIMHLMHGPIARARAPYAPLLATHSIRITLTHGECAMSAVGLIAFGIMLCHPMNYVDEGLRIAEIALRIVEKHNAVEIKCRVLLCLFGLAKPWKEPIKKCLEPLLEAARQGHSTGDIEGECVSLMLRSNFRLFSGVPLAKIEGEIRESLALCRDRQQDTAGFNLALMLQTLLNFRSHSSNPSVLEGEIFSEMAEMENSTAASNATGVANILIFKCLLAMYFGDFVAAQRISQWSRKVNKDALNPSNMFQVHFLDGMAEVVVARQSKSRIHRMRAGRRPLAKLRAYARNCPGNVLNKIYLIEAERHVLFGQLESARKKFDLSIRKSRLEGFLHEEALANERAGMTFLELDKKLDALDYFEQARKRYERWGATVKVEEISKRIESIRGAAVTGQ